jgi:hypothetical protein
MKTMARTVLPTGDYTIVSNAMYRDPLLQPLDVWLFGRLAGEGPRFEFTAATLSRLWHIGERQVKAALSRLRRAGYVLYHRCRSGNGSYGSISVELTEPVEVPIGSSGATSANVASAHVATTVPIGSTVSMFQKDEDLDDKHSPPEPPHPALSLVENRGTMNTPPRRRKNDPIDGQRSLYPSAVPDVEPTPAAAPVRGNPVVAGWVDHCRTNGVQLPPRLIGQYARYIKAAQDAGFADVLIKRALASMLTDGVADRPSLFDNRLVKVQTGPERRVSTKPGPDARARAIIELGIQMQQEQDQRAIGGSA